MVRLVRREFLVAGCALASTLVTRPSSAASSQPVKIVLPFAPGGVTDLLARSFSAHLQQSLGEPVIVENRAGASGIIATDAVAKAAPDGKTMLVAAIGQAIVNNYLFNKLPYDPKTDLVPVSLLAEGNNVLVVNAQSSLKSVSDLVAAAKGKPGELAYGSFGQGSTPHLSAALFAEKTGTRFTHVPYKGSGPAMNDLLGGQTSFQFDTLITSMPHIKAGTLRALAVTGPKRVGVLPDIPTMAEAGVIGYNIMAWFGIFMPGKTPPDIVEKMSRQASAFTRLQTVRKQFHDQGLDLVSSTPVEYRRFLEAENEKWAEIVRVAHIVRE